MGMSKKDQIAELENALEEANQRAERNADEVRRLVIRNDARQEQERYAAERKRKQDERAERLKRVENIQAGLLPIEGATQWAIVHEEGSKSGIEVFVPLSEVEEREVQEYLNKPGERRASDLRYCEPIALTGYQRRMQDAINKIAENAHRARTYYTF